MVQQPNVKHFEQSHLVAGGLGMHGSHSFCGVVHGINQRTTHTQTFDYLNGKSIFLREGLGGHDVHGGLGLPNSFSGAPNATHSQMKVARRFQVQRKKVRQTARQRSNDPAGMNINSGCFPR